MCGSCGRFWGNLSSSSVNRYDRPRDHVHMEAKKSKRIELNHLEQLLLTICPTY